MAGWLPVDDDPGPVEIRRLSVEGAGHPVAVEGSAAAPAEFERWQRAGTVLDLRVPRLEDDRRPTRLLRQAGRDACREP